MPLQTLDTFSFNHSDQVDKLYEGKTSAQVKALLDSRGVDLQTKLNNIVNVLLSIVDADSGADNIGVTSIPELSGNTVQAVLESLKAYITAQLQGITLGAIPNDSITEAQMAADMKKQSGGIAKYDDVGNVANLTTLYKTIVGAINEIDSILDTHLADELYQVAGGTATAITLTGVVLENGHSKTFIASADNGGSASTVNGKPLYKAGTTNPPVLKKDKAYTIWYNSTSTCFFIKASATGNTIPPHVLAGDTFSTDTDTDQVGTAPLKSGITYTPTTSDQTIGTGWEDGTCKIKGDSNLISPYIVSGHSIFNVPGSATIESLGGKKYATGSLTTTSNGWAEVTGLSFTPSLVFVAKPSSAYFTVYWTSLSTTDTYLVSGSVMPATYALDGTNCYVNNGGFRVDVQAASSFVNWIAVE